jgi:hypothetical protein
MGAGGTVLWTTKTMRRPGPHHRYIEIEKLTETACIFANGELIQGFLAGSAAKRYGHSMYRASKRCAKWSRNGPRRCGHKQSKGAAT